MHEEHPMNDAEVKSVREFLHGISNDLSISYGNSNILDKKMQISEGNLEKEEILLRLQKINLGIEKALLKIDTYRKVIQTTT